MALDIHVAISSVTLAGNVISFFATTSVLISFAIYHHHIRTFRQMLILELMLFEFANNLNNSVSGIWHLKNGELSIGTLCAVNGFIGQFSAQGVDLSILAIAVVTLFTVTRRIYMPSVSMTKRICICVSISTLPLITSIIPTFMGEMQPVGGNWCWIAINRPDLRYTMAHGWRIFGIFSTITIYIYIWVYLRRRLGPKPHRTRQLRCDAASSNRIGSLPFKSPKRSGFQVMGEEEVELDSFERGQPSTSASNPSPETFFEERRAPHSPKDTRFKEINLELADRSPAGSGETKGGVVRHRPTASKSGADPTILEDSSSLFPDPSQSRQSQHSQSSVSQTNASEFHMRPDADQVELEIKRMLLLNAYPFMYVLLWMPGLVNRLMEASGNPNSKTINVALQAPTQFIGLANALTYGFNHYLRDRLNDLYLRPMIARVKDHIRLS